MADKTTDDRLSRIEVKLDELTGAVVSLARVEERMVTLFRRMDLYDKDQREMTARVSKVELAVGKSGYFLRFAERLFWIAVTAGTAAYFTGVFA